MVHSRRACIILPSLLPGSFDPRMLLHQHIALGLEFGGCSTMSTIFCSMVSCCSCSSSLAACGACRESIQRVGCRQPKTQKKTLSAIHAAALYVGVDSAVPRPPTPALIKAFQLGSPEKDSPIMATACQSAWAILAPLKVAGLRLLGIPRALGHPFHEHLDSDSTLTWTPIPRSLGH